MTGPMYDMPESIELSWTQYRLIAQALDDADVAISRWEPTNTPLVRRIREALQVLLRVIWPDLGDDDSGSLRP